MELGKEHHASGSVTSENREGSKLERLGRYLNAKAEAGHGRVPLDREEDLGTQERCYLAGGLQGREESSIAAAEQRQLHVADGGEVGVP